MKEYLKLREQLINLEIKEAERIARELILKSEGESTDSLRKSTLNYIHQNNLPEGISHKVKNIIDIFISNLKIPAQKTEQV